MYICEFADVKGNLKEFVFFYCVPIWIKISIHETLILIVYQLLTAADDSGAPADQCGGPDSGRAFPVQRAAAWDGGQAAGDAGARFHQDARGVHGPWPAHATQGGDWGPQGSPGGGGEEVRQAVGCRLGWWWWVGDSGVYAWVAVGCKLGWRWLSGYGGIYARVMVGCTQSGAWWLNSFKAQPKSPIHGLVCSTSRDKLHWIGILFAPSLLGTC